MFSCTILELNSLFRKFLVGYYCCRLYELTLCITILKNSSSKYDGRKNIDIFPVALCALVEQQNHNINLDTSFSENPSKNLTKKVTHLNTLETFSNNDIVSIMLFVTFRLNFTLN